MENVERRFAPATELRAESREDGTVGIMGSAAVFSRETDLGEFTEEIAPGAFDKVLDDDVRGLFNHDPNFVLGRSPRTMSLAVKKDGLHYEIPSLPKARADVAEAIQRKDVTGNSFSFTVAEDRWIEDRAKPHRVIERVGQLYDVGPVTFPAYEDTRVSARAELRARALRAQREADEWEQMTVDHSNTLKMLEIELAETEA